MPRFVHVTFTVLAWLSVPLWVLSIAGGWLFDFRLMSLTVNVASTVTVAWALLYVRQAHDRLAVRRQDLADAREAALILAIERLAAGPGPEAQAQLTLRAVS